MRGNWGRKERDEEGVGVVVDWAGTEGGGLIGWVGLGAGELVGGRGMVEGE